MATDAYEEHLIEVIRGLSKLVVCEYASEDLGAIARSMQKTAGLTDNEVRDIEQWAKDLAEGEAE